MKKFLSLVLSLVMAVSLVTVSAGATDFEDDEDITYQEAVTVIQGIGVVDGYTDGTFRPDDVLTRGAAAKIICNLILGPTTADALSASSAPFVDVPTTNTFAGYITFCSQQGIISGYADGTFRPTGTLSGNAFMKMLLGALGYDSAKEGYTGTNWTVNVIKQAVGIGLDDGNDNFVGSQAVTRQEACLYAFNTLQATMVQYSDNSTVTVGDITINTQGSYSDVSNTTRTDGNIEDDELMQFAERYFTDLEAEDDTDAFGRPATTWVYDGTELGTYANDADETFVVDDTTDTLQTLMTDGDCLNYSSSHINSDAAVYFNGTDEGTYSENRNVALAGKGDIVEVYEDSRGNAETIVFRSYTYAKVDTVDTSLSSTHTNRGASVGIELVDIDDNSVGTYYNDYNSDSKILKGYNSSYTEGTVLAVAYGESGAVLDSYIAESVTGTPTAAREVQLYSNGYVRNGTITIDGTRYTYAGQMTGIGEGENVDFDQEYTIYLTAEGYVLAVDGDSTAALDDVYYVAGVYRETSRGRTSYYLEAVAVRDGTAYDLELDSSAYEDFGTSSLSAANPYDSSVAGLYVLDEDDDEWFIDSAYEGALEDGDEVGRYTVIVSEYDDASGLSQDVTSTSTTIRFNNSTAASRLYLMDDTFFISVDGVAGEDSLSVKTATGMMTVDADSDNLSVYALTKTDSSDAAFVIYVSDDLSGAVNIDDVVYLTDDATTSNSNGYVVDLYFMGDMTLEEDVTIDSKENQGFYVYDVDDDNIYSLSTETSYKLPDGEVDDDADGYAENVVFDTVRSNRASGSVGSIEFVAVSFANATVIDTRSNSVKNASLYSGDIESVSALSSAINRGEVKADVFVEDGEIVFVAVTDTERETATGLSVGPITGLEFSFSRTSGFEASLDEDDGLEEGDTVYVRATDGYTIDVDNSGIELSTTSTSGTYSFQVEDDVTTGDIAVIADLDIEITNAEAGEDAITLTFDGTEDLTGYTVRIYTYRQAGTSGYGRVATTNEDLSSSITVELTGNDTESVYYFDVTVYDAEGEVVGSFTSDNFSLVVTAAE